MSKLKRLAPALLIVGSIASTIGLTELALYLGWIKPRLARTLLFSAGMTSSKEEFIIPDPQLGHRPNPRFPGHDARGWRNARALDRADLVALGDSQTYGLAVHLEDAWPQLLGATTGKSVYQMAVGGYGPVHYLQEFNELKKLAPKTVLAMFYLGNDLADSFQAAYGIGLQSADGTGMPITTGNLERFKTKNPVESDRIARAERTDPHFLRTRYLDCQSIRVLPDQRLQAVTGILDSVPLGPLERPHTLLPLLDRILWGRSQIFALARTAWENTSTYPAPLCLHYREGPLSTMFTPGYRLTALTRTDPRIVEGERIAFEALTELSEKCRKNGIRFAVLILPTKERVYMKRVRSKFARETLLEEQWAEESKTMADAETFFSKHAVPFLNLLPALEDLVSEGKNPFKEATGKPFDDGDGHYAANGNQAIGHAVAHYLGRDAL